MSRETTAIESGTTILSRVLEAHATSFTPEAARAILQLKFDQVDIDRMHVLAEKNETVAMAPGYYHPARASCKA